MSLSTKHIVIPQGIDEAAAFRHILNLPGNTLLGEDLKIRSPFSIDRTPSFSIYITSDGSYGFNCFSTGRNGDVVDLLLQIKKQAGIIWDRLTAVQYLESITPNTEAFDSTKPVLNGKGRVTSYEMRTWNHDDGLFWGKYGISFELLESLNVAPLSEFRMEKLRDGVTNEFLFNHARMYGYFRKTGDLHKIYRPGSKKGKCIKVGGPYVEGSDQIIKPKENLLVIKSTKDIAGFKTLEIPDWDCVAPDAEGILLPKQYVMTAKGIYKKIMVYMDPDAAGVIAQKKYSDQYQLPGIELGLGYKDLTDCLEKIKYSIVRNTLINLLN
jgi:hypothetical protein